MLGRKLTLAGSALLVMGLGVGAPAAAAPFAALYVNGGLVDSWTCADAEFDCSGKVAEFFYFDSNASYDITLTGTFDPDPRIDYAATVIDHGAANTFNLVFQQDIVSTLAPGTATHDFSSSTTDGDFNGVPVSPIATLPGISSDAPGTADEISVFNLSQDAGTTWINAALDLGPAFVGAATGSDTQGPYGPVTSGGPSGTGSYNAMRVDVNFSMQGGDDAYSPGGFAQIVVPEPLSLGLLGLGIVALGIAGRRRQ
jgi:PEP-CTERM motif-containing protein